jgi:uncharacterized protein (DUF433 family)
MRLALSLLLSSEKAIGRMTLQELENVIATLTQAEKAQVLQWLVRDLGGAFPGIDSHPDVMDGEARIVRTRIPVWVLVQLRNQEASEAEILRSYPTLRAEDLANAWAYARLYRDEIAREIIENETA